MGTQSDHSATDFRDFLRRRAANRIRQLESRKIGLVLEGGGAKGAYAFGWLQAFQERGIKFDAVAGTSVGALNALIWATGQLNSGEAIWRNISAENVLAKKNLRILRLLLIIPYAIRRRLIAEWIANFKDVTDAAYFAAILGLLTIVPIYWFITGVIASLISLVILIEDPQFLSIVSSLRFTGAAALTILSMVYFGFTDMDPWPNFASRSNSPLKNKIESLLEENDLRIPTYVTVAKYKEVYDPCDMWLWRSRTGTLWKGRSRYVPSYFRVDKMSKREQVEIALASSALPYGITSSVEIGDECFVDGGLGDNNPIYPLVKFEHCGQVIVISLNEDSVALRNPLAHCNRIERLLIASRFTEKEAARKRLNGECVWFRDVNRGQRITVIKPSVALGTLLNREMRYFPRLRWPRSLDEYRAVLAFDASFADRLINLARSDADKLDDDFWRKLVS